MSKGLAGIRRSRSALGAGRRVLWPLGAALALSFVFMAQAFALQAGNTCPTSSPPFAGREVKTQDEHTLRYMMVSAYHLAPYDQAYVDNVLTDLARMDVAGIVYSTLGELSDFFARQRKIELDEASYNDMIFAQARDRGADMWLQMRVYANQIRPVGEHEARNLLAEEIIEQPAARQAFRQQLRADLVPYDRHFGDRCRIVMFEEAGIYHSPVGGGTFWSSSQAKLKRSQRHDEMFAERMARIFKLAHDEIETINPACQVGMHLGHSVFLNPPLLRQWIDWLKQQDAAPDFIFYDFYLKAQRDFDAYRRKLSQRRAIIDTELGLPALHLAQLHTMNNFQHGGGKTPSRAEIDAAFALDQELGFDGIGFYTKNARATKVRANDPFDPNVFAQSTVYESSKDRWDYGLLLLAQLGGIDFSRRLDLVLSGRFGNDGYRVLLHNPKSAQWDFIATVDPTRQKNYRGSNVIVLRNIDAAYLEQGRQLKLKFTASGDFRKGYLRDAFVIPSEPASSFRPASEIRREIDGGRAPAGTVARVSRVALDREETVLEMCTY